jgi:hypothetical protein
VYRCMARTATAPQNGPCNYCCAFSIAKKNLAERHYSQLQDPSEKELKSMVEQVDSNHDGKLDFPEFLKLMKAKKPVRSARFTLLYDQ